MEVKQARKQLDGKIDKITSEQILEQLQENGQKILYLDKENSAKDIKKFCDIFSKKGFSVHYHEIYYGLDSGDFLYEVHLIQNI
ncbi:hypothetical protein CCZ01_01215 [Helicobacter monodelphidis]|uniref:HP0268 family nuclease n=1 Tax=Helicobacter sp. 15-1451 TaxID=2004995 RepID=UPI000DCC6F91|nr:HP0268 family nuclease [Helicobacter sp. 15-1451]RAX58843.1 hypothetical protein CCZ01_01215 [Helicobacter sp. 15-1451]